MTSSRTIPWPRILAEGGAIVVSILLAFAIDAWWQERSDRTREQTAIRRLIVEYETNLQRLENDRADHQNVLTATGRLLDLIGPDPAEVQDPDAMARLLIDCLTNPVLEPRLGTTNSLIASGEIRLLQDEEIQSKLTEWPMLAQELIEWQEIERMHGEELILDLTYDYVAWPDMDVALGFEGNPSRFDSDFEGLLSSMRFEGLLDNRRWNTREAIERIDDLETETRALIERLESQLAD